jgi:polyhydroxyalkanoate synthase
MPFPSAADFGTPFEHAVRLSQAAARGFRQTLDDDGALKSLSAAWRLGHEALALVPPALRGAAEAPRWRRGPAPAGSQLGDDYPTDAFEAIRGLWVAAARTAVAGTPWLGDNDERARLTALADALQAAEAPALAPTPRAIVHEGDDLRLFRIAPGVADERLEPVLVLASLVNRSYVLDLLEGRSFLSVLAATGRPVYLAEWKEPRAGDARELGDLVAGPALAALDRVSRRHDGRPVALLGYSMGGTLASMLTARWPDRVARLGTLSGPVAFEHAGAFARWFAREHLDVGVVAAAWPRVPAALVHLPFWWLNPGVKMDKLATLARGFERPGFLECFLALEVWNHDNVDLGSGVFRSWAGDLYQDDALVNGRLRVDGEPLDLARVACPLLVVSGSRDDITPPEACEALADRARSRFFRVNRVDAGHAGVLSSRRVLSSLAPSLEQWLDAPLHEEV